MDYRLQDNLCGVQQDYIAPFLWLHWEDDQYIVETIERIYDSGIRSVCLESRTHEDFVRDGWWSDVQLILEECKKRGMKVWILDDKHYPTGYSNGIFIEKYKELLPWCITEQHMDVVGPVVDGAAMASGWTASPNDEILAVIALKHIPDSEKYSETINITGGLSEDMVYFTLTEGMWRIVFLIKTRSGYAARHSMYCDMLNPAAVDLFVEEVYEPHYTHFKEYFGDTLLGFFSDEPGFKNNGAVSWDTDLGCPFMHHPWGDSVVKRLKDKYGDKFMEVLSGIWFDIGGDDSADIRYTYMDIITDEYRRNFCNKIGNWCHKHGVKYIGHIIEDNHMHARTGAGPGHYFRSMDGQDMSGIDVVLHQILPGLAECANAGRVIYHHMNNEFFHYYLGKLASSFAHIDPVKQGRAMCEIFGAYGWAEGSKVMKYLMDHMLVRGINYFVPHAFSPMPNDKDCPPNFYDTGHNPQYRYFKDHMDYMNRMCYMLNDGKHISTCALLYDAENRWINGEYLPLEKVAKVLYDNLFDYDVIPIDYLKYMEKGCLNGEKYNVLLIPYAQNIPEEIQKKIQAADVEVVLVTAEDYLEDTCKYIGKEIKRNCNDPWRQVTLSALPEYMKTRGFDDVQADYQGGFLRYYHYQRNGADIYMFSNEDINHVIDTKLTLSGFAGGRYVEYDAFENSACVKNSAYGTISLHLDPYHSLMIMTGDVSVDEVEFVRNEAAELLTEPVQGDVSNCQISQINPVFRISIAERNSEEFQFYKETDQLFNLTGAKELPRFSGHIRYEGEFVWDSRERGRHLLNLGQVGEIAELYLNDVHIGKKLIPPYCFDITEGLQKGVNRMMVEVTNHNGYAVRDEFSRFMMFEPSGILGPIFILRQ